MAYVETAEYAFDLLEHFYQLHKNAILVLGAENIRIYIPEKIFGLLAAVEGHHENDQKMFPKQFRSMDLVPYCGSTIIFALKEVR